MACRLSDSDELRGLFIACMIKRTAKENELANLELCSPVGGMAFVAWWGIIIIIIIIIGESIPFYGSDDQQPEKKSFELHINI